MIKMRVKMREKRRDKGAKLTTDLANLRFRDKTLF